MALRFQAGGPLGPPFFIFVEPSVAFGRARNPPFMDGNKRIAFVAVMVFLRLNGIRFAPDQAQATAAIIGLAAGDIDEAGLTRWIRDNWPES